MSLSDAQVFQLVEMVSALGMASASVRLNVGGSLFETTTETLQKAPYFRCFLEGHMGHATDADGRLFLDRNGILFGHLLDFLRAGTLPPESVLRDCRGALLEEAAFFGVEHLSHRLRREISPYDLRAEDRELQAEEAAASRGEKDLMMWNVHSAGAAPRDRVELQLPLLLQANGTRPAVVGSFSDFYERLDKFSGGLIEALSGIPGLIVAGGSVLGALCSLESADLDLYIKTGEADTAFRSVFDAVKANHSKRNGSKARLLVTRSNAAVTIFRLCGRIPDKVPPVQVVLTKTVSVSTLLADFDVDCCAFAWELGTDRVLTTRRGLRAMRYSCNVVDSHHDSPSYCRRLEKYAGRGFCLAVPGFEPTRVKPSLLGPNFLRIKKYDLVLEVEPKVLAGKEVSLQALRPGFGSEAVPRLLFGFLQKGKSLTGFQRLVVLDRACIQDAQIPSVVFCEKRRKTDALHAVVSNACCPLVIGSGRFLLLWGAGASMKDDEAEEFYSETPLAAVYRILNKTFESGLRASDEQGAAELPGGWVYNVSKSKSVHQAATALYEEIASRLGTRQKLRFVYDLTNCETAFDELKYVNDAMRGLPEELSDEEFLRTAGIPRRLAFRPHGLPRPTYRSDWWSSVY